jgi:hypothetical protein
VVDLDDRLAIEAAELSVETELALADSIILASARAHDAELWTQDTDFEGLDGARYQAHVWFRIGGGGGGAAAAGSYVVRLTVAGRDYRVPVQMLEDVWMR